MKKVKEDQVTLKVSYDESEDIIIIESSKGIKHMFPGNAYNAAVSALTISTFIEYGERVKRCYPKFEISMIIKAG